VDRLLSELLTHGTLDPDAVAWAEQHLADERLSADTSLLELDLVDEAGLLHALARCYGVAVASPSDLEGLSTELGRRLPHGFSRSFSLCPVRLSGDTLTALVSHPLSEGSRQELGELFGLQVHELLAPVHYLLVAEEKVYGATLDDRHRAIETRLARRRRAPSLEAVTASLGGAASLADAVDALLDYASCFVEFPCLFVCRGDSVRVACSRRAGREGPESVPLPGPGSALSPALLHGGSFFGAPSGTPADRAFFAALGRPLPRRVFVAPVPAARARGTFVYADNADRGIAARWIAELMLLVGRLWQGSFESRRTRSDGDPPLGPSDADETGARAFPALTPDDQAAVYRLQLAASRAHMHLPEFVDELLRSRGGSPAPATATTALMEEMKLLFERLATDIPAHLARGMQAALRDVAPPMPPPRGTTPPSAAASVELVAAPAARSEPEGYQARRRKAQRVKL
jgi:hypothetical protein